MNNQIYWNNAGKYQELSQKLEKLIPNSGDCEDTRLELFRLVSNAYYDIYNNGGCNAHRFRLLKEFLAKTGMPDTFSAKEAKTLKAWLEKASDGEEEGYLFDFRNSPEWLESSHIEILNLFEKLTDWTILQAKPCLIQPGKQCKIKDWSSLDLLTKPLFEETRKPIIATVLVVNQNSAVVTPELLREVYLEVELPLTALSEN